MAKEKKVSYVRMENANLVEMTFRRLAERFADYSNLIIGIKKMNDKRNKMRENFIKKVKTIEDEFGEMKDFLPEEPTTKIKKAKKPKKKEKVEVDGQLESFRELEDEFKRIKSELEEIKSS